MPISPHVESYDAVFGLLKLSDGGVPPRLATEIAMNEQNSGVESRIYLFIGNYFPIDFEHLIRQRIYNNA